MYRIPFFDDSTPGDVTISTLAGPRTRGADPITAGVAVERAWQAHLDRCGPVWKPAINGYPGYYGTFLYGGELQTRSLVYIYSVESVAEDGWPRGVRWQIGRFEMLRYADEKDKVVRTALRPAAQWVLTETRLSTDYNDVLRRIDEREEALPENHRLPSAVRERMARVVAEFAEAVPGAAVWTLDNGSNSNEVVLAAATEGSWGIAHSPIRFSTEPQLVGVEDEAEGSGGEYEGRGRDSDDRAREGGGSLGTAEGHGVLWPALDLAGGLLVCEPFSGEPPVGRLVTGGEALEAEMRGLTAALDLDYCGYAGNLCLNLAKLIGTRAHAVGIASIDSITTTSVQTRPDGGGNNGFVDLGPGGSAELRYMQALATAAARVVGLARLVSRTYLAEANHDVIGSVTGYAPAAWALRFWAEIADAMPQTCMWLYAETCRIIMLQQLRSSHAGIVARQSRFHETRRRFDEALGILGESVVKLSVLRTAVSHAGRYSLTGPVRTVLSHPPPPRRMGSGEYHEAPAPIDSMPGQIVDLLERNGASIEVHGDTHVARWDNRLWTIADLEQGAGLRRSVLNLVDPLFNQVPDLDRLYRDFRHDPATSENYLRDLLDQMRRCNEAMARNTENKDTGAFFALEASQWVAAEGGTNALGLRYSLQGIHKLADDALRPWVGSISYYNEGVDAAIAVKADWDRFVQAFEVGGVIVLALLCAPLGATAVALVTGLAGIAMAIDEELETEQKEALYRSLEDPEAILAWQDVQLARLMADLSIAFAVFDVIGVAKAGSAIAAGARAALREIAAQGVRSTARAGLQAARRAVLANMAKEVMANAIKQAAHEAAVATVMELVVPEIITPVLVPWIRGVALEHGSLTRVDAVLGNLASGQPTTPAPVRGPLPAAFGSPPGEEAADTESDSRPAAFDAGSGTTDAEDGR